MNPEDIEEGYEWVEAWEPVSLPEFVKQSAKGEMKMINGKIHVKAPAEDLNFYRYNYWDYQDEEPEEPLDYKDKHGK